MSYTIGQYETLQKAIASGAITVKYGDKDVTYRSTDDMLKILDLMKAELFPEQRPIKHKVVVYDKGVYPTNPHWKNEFYR